MPLRCVGSVLLIISFLSGATCSPDLVGAADALAPCLTDQAEVPDAVKSLLQKLSAVKPRTTKLRGAGASEASSLHEALAKLYASGLMPGEGMYQVALCWYDHALQGEMAIERHAMLQVERNNLAQIIRREVHATSAEGARPAQDEHKNLVQKSGGEADLAKQLTVEYAEMFDSIWEKYSQGQESMKKQQLNSLLRATDHELGEQEITDDWWLSLCEEHGADPSHGLSKRNLLSMYFEEHGSIKRDYYRIFAEGGAAPTRCTQGRCAPKKKPEEDLEQFIQDVMV